MKNLGVYVHCPFCISKCKYCNFNSFVVNDSIQYDYVSALVKEIREKSKMCNTYIVDTIYFGGGTPSCLFDGAIATILGEIKKNYRVKKDAEISIECNPKTLTYQKALEYKTCGINRVSVGLQTTNKNLLNLIGRTHTVEDFFDTIKLIKNVGISDINVDIMVGLPKQKLSDVKATIRQILKCGVSHVSCYSLILEEGTPLYYEVANGKLKLPKEEKALGMYNYVYKILKENGFNRYEVSNFALDNCECIHNIHTWQMCEYIGFGCSAHSFMSTKILDSKITEKIENKVKPTKSQTNPLEESKYTRFSNCDNLPKYIDFINASKSTEQTVENITEHERFDEYIMLSLRLKDGISLKYIKDNFFIDLLKTKKATIENLIKLKLINVDKDRIYATDLGYTLLNKVIIDIVS